MEEYRSHGITRNIKKFLRRSKPWLYEQQILVLTISTDTSCIRFKSIKKIRRSWKGIYCFLISNITEDLPANLIFLM